MSLTCWGYFVDEQGPHTPLEVVARLPWCLATPGELTLLTCHPAEQGWSPPSLAEHRHWPGESLLYAGVTWACFFVVTPAFDVDWGRALSSSHVMTVELQRWLLAWERELDSREGAIIMWKEGLASSVHAYGEVHVECDASHAHVDAVQRDFFTQARTSISRSEKITDIGRMLEEC
jgi:hypothetical protein